MKIALQIVSFSANKAWEASFWLGFHLFQKDLHSAFGFKVFNYLLLICLFILTKIYRCFTIQDGPFWGCSLMRGGKKASLPKIQWSYNDETWYKHVLHKEDLKYVWITWHSLNSAHIRVFSAEISKLGYIKKYKYRLHFGA